MLKQADNVLPGLRKLFPIFCLALMFLLHNGASAQVTKSFSGKITDSETGEALPYVTVFVKLPNHTTKGTTTDFSGVYHLVVPQVAGDSLYAHYIGYIPAQKVLPKQ